VLYKRRRCSVDLYRIVMATQTQVSLKRKSLAEEFLERESNVTTATVTRVELAKAVDTQEKVYNNVMKLRERETERERDRDRELHMLHMLWPNTSMAKKPTQLNSTHSLLEYSSLKAGFKNI
jgi:hypothetical protein